MREGSASLSRARCCRIMSHLASLGSDLMLGRTLTGKAISSCVTTSACFVRAERGREWLQLYQTHQCLLEQPLQLFLAWHRFGCIVAATAWWCRWLLGLLVLLASPERHGGNKLVWGDTRKHTRNLSYNHCSLLSAPGPKDSTSWLVLAQHHSPQNQELGVPSACCTLTPNWRRTAQVVQAL